MNPGYEKLGAFYLGKRFDPAVGKRQDDLLLYDAKDLVTHAVCFGMTGSGKTGLCTVLLEEAAIDGIPAIVIDPKGDMSNLLLNFPELKPEDFLPWIPEGAAEQKSVSPDAYAAQQAELWRTGLASWDQDGSRIARLRAAVDMALYTPGSEAGMPVALLRSFDPPPAELREDKELFRESIQASVSALLGLLGVDADPVQSREHILLSLLLSDAWQKGKGLNLAALIGAIQKPPMERVGVLDLESFFPAKDRFELAMRLNNLVAAPGFQAWLQGDPLDVDRFLFTDKGKPRISIFSIAHLSDPERMFFVSMLLNQVVSWMRKQPGTTSLRALVYMDEIFGYFPPVANPPSKTPLLTLLKQARAFGVGTVLATQNPVDLDYKGLSNAGTWLIGRLQTERDQARVLDGLGGAAAGSGRAFDRAAMGNTLAGLGKRVFLMYNVHDEAPEIFETRWALSYLCGPLTRSQIKRLKPVLESEPAGPDGSEQPRPAGSQQPVRAPRPVLPPGIQESFLPVRSIQPASAKLTYRPMLLAAVRVHFNDTKRSIDHPAESCWTTRFQNQAVTVDWQTAQPLELPREDLEREPQPDAGYLPPPTDATEAKSYSAWEKDFANWIYRTQRLTLYSSPSLKQTSQAGESERDFRIRMDLLAREERDRQVQQLRDKYAPKIARLEEKIRKAEQSVEREQQQAQSQKLQSAISIGASLLGAFLGRKVVSATSVSRAGTAVRSVGRARKEAADIERAQENVEAARSQLAELESEFKQDVEETEVKLDPLTEDFQTVEIKPRKSDIAVLLCSLAWAPHWQNADGTETPAW